MSELTLERAVDALRGLYGLLQLHAHNPDIARHLGSWELNHRAEEARLVMALEGQHSDKRSEKTPTIAPAALPHVFLSFSNNRCYACDWPLDSCTPFNCSYRPGERAPEYEGWKRRLHEMAAVFSWATATGEAASDTPSASARRSEMEKNAARYRYLRGTVPSSFREGLYFYFSGPLHGGGSAEATYEIYRVALDKAIDDAMDRVADREASNGS